MLNTIHNKNFISINLVQPLLHRYVREKLVSFCYYIEILRFKLNNFDLFFLFAKAPKHVGILHIRLDKNKEFEIQLKPIKLKTVRQFYLENISLNLHFDKIGKKHATVLDVEDFCTKKIEEMIQKAKEEHSGEPNQPELPLIRLRVDYTDEYLTLSANHFGQRFVGRVANPKEVILFKCKKTLMAKTTIDTNLDIIDEMYEDMNEEQAKHCGIDDVINEYFDNVDPLSKLTLLGEKKLTEAVKEIVEKDTQSAKINMLINWHIRSVKEHIMQKNDVDKILEDQFLVREIMHDFKEQIRIKQEDEKQDLIDFEELEEEFGKKKKPSAKQAAAKTKATAKGKGKKNEKLFEDEEEMDLEDFYDGEEDISATKRIGINKVDSSTDDSDVAVVESNDSDVEDVTPAKGKKKPSTRGRGRGGSTRGRGRGASRGGKANKGLSDFFTVSK